MNYFRMNMSQSIKNILLHNSIKEFIFYKNIFTIFAKKISVFINLKLIILILKEILAI